LPAAIASSPGFPPEAATSPTVLHALPAAVAAPVVNAYAESLQTVFLWAVPVALAALVVALFLPQVTLRSRVTAAGAGDGFAIPQGSDADTQLENVIGQVLKQKGESAAPEVLRASGSSLDIPTSWGVFGVYLRDAITGSAIETSIERSVGVPHGVLRPFFDEIVEAGFLTREGDVLRLTPEGRRQAQLITPAWRVWLIDELQEWLPAAGAEMPQTEKVDAALDRIVVRLVRESELEAAPA